MKLEENIKLERTMHYTVCQYMVLNIVQLYQIYFNIFGEKKVEKDSTNFC